MDSEATVALRSASFRYERGGDWVVKDFDLAVRSSDQIALYGPNGCGKSTLLYLLGGLLTPENGERTTGPNLRTGFVFQDYTRSLLNWYTVAENLDLALREPGQPSAAKFGGRASALHKVFAGEAPEWIERSLGKFPYELSGGQRQLVSLLRALLVRPRVLLLDEPFASLDVGHKRLAVELLQRARTCDSGWLVIAHELDDCFLTADRIVVLQGPPLSVARTVDVPLDWPRSFRALGDPEIQAAREHVYEVLWDVNAKS